MDWGFGRLTYCAWMTWLALVIMCCSAQAADNKHKVESKKQIAAIRSNINIEVCFTLDTTGSMSGLIEGAKKKIWSIANNIVSLDPRPNVSFCLLGYRDKGDDYVTVLTDLTQDIDKIYSELLTFQAGGGGDTPESVNQALDETINQVSWSQDANTLRIVYLVGDAPPHMDYPQEKQYPAIAADALRKDIVINAIQCGNMQETTPIWQEIARLSGGRFAKLIQSGNVKEIRTPMDQDFVALNRKIGDTLLPYGSSETREEALSQQKSTETASETTIADRLSYNARTQKIKQSRGDLIDDLQDGVIKLEEIPDKHLPTSLQGLTLSDKRAYIQTKQKARENFQKIISNLNIERQAYIDKHDHSNESSFDKEVISGVKDLARKKGLELN